MYEVLIERTAERDLKSLPATLFDRIVPRINGHGRGPETKERELIASDTRSQ